MNRKLAFGQTVLVASRGCVASDHPLIRH